MSLKILLWSFLFAKCQSTHIQIEPDGGYVNVVVTISPSLQYTDDIINIIKDFLTKANEELFIATYDMVFIKSISIVVPNSWTAVPTETASFETYEDADIQILSLSESQQFDPHTQQPRGCGHEGKSMQLSLESITNSAENQTLIKMFTREWAKLRYGIFDETAHNSNYPNTYVDANGEVRKTGCASPYPWFQSDCEDKDGVMQCSEFTLNHTLMPLQSSIMDDVSLNATYFCQDSDNHPHNGQSPTRHNALCKRKSTWKIMSENKDFANLQSDKNVTSLDLEVKLVKIPPMAVVIILDPYLFQPRYPRLTLLWFAVHRFIKHLVASDVYGLVIADHLENCCISFEENLEELDIIMFKRDNNSTRDLKHGIDKAAEMLRSKKNFTKNILLISNGMELDPNSTLTNIQEYIDTDHFKFMLLTWTVKDEMLNYMSLDMKIFFNQMSAVWFNIQMDSLEECNIAVRLLLDDAFTLFFNRFGNVNIHTKKIKVKNFQGDTAEFKIPMDNATIHFVSQFCNNIIQSHAKNITCTPTCNYVEDKNVHIENAPDTWKSLKWESSLPKNTHVKVTWYVLADNYRQNLETSIWASTYSSIPTLSGQLVQQEVPSEPYLLYAYSHENMAISAEVITFNGSKHTIDLRDNGSGDPDIKANDGIFSRYLVFPNMQEGMVSINIMSRDANGDIIAQTDLGAYILSIELDNLPPNWIGDFRVNNVNIAAGSVFFKWTAPGAYYDHKSAHHYLIKCATTVHSLKSEGETLKITPREAGQEETLTYNIPSRDTLFYCGIWSMNDRNLSSEISNIVTVYIPALPTTTTTTTLKTTALLTTQLGEHSSTAITFPQSQTSTSEVSSVDVVTTESTEQSKVTTDSEETSTQECSCLSIAEISGIAIAAVVLTIIAVILIICCMHKCRKKGKKRPFGPQISATYANNRADVIRSPSSRSSAVDIDNNFHDSRTSNRMSSFQEPVRTKPNNRDRQQTDVPPPAYDNPGLVDSDADSHTDHSIEDAAINYATINFDPSANQFDSVHTPKKHEPVNYATIKSNKKQYPSMSTLSTFENGSKNNSTDALYAEVRKERKQIAQPETPLRKFITITQV